MNPRRLHRRRLERRRPRFLRAWPAVVLAVCAVVVIAVVDPFSSSSSKHAGKAAGLPAGSASPTTTVPPLVFPPGPPPPDWFGTGKLVFNDEFLGSRLNAAWANCYPWGDCINVGNKELEWYTPSNVSVDNGELDLTARHQPVSTKLGRFNYTSGLVQTAKRFSFTYGYTEIQAWFPGGKGFWPAFWLLPVDGTFPPEIDVFEAEGSVPAEVAMTTHYGAKQYDQSRFDGTDFTSGWHTFGVDWEPDHLTWYVDGIVRKSVSTTAEIPSKPMYLIVNLAIDGNDPPNVNTGFPSRLRVRYVRVWLHSHGGPV